MIRMKIIDAADQKYSTIINNRRVTIRLRFNHASGFWAMDLALDGDYVLHGRRIVLNMNLIKPFGFNIGAIFAYSPSGANPGRTELVDGTVGLYQASEEEVNASVAS